MPEGGLGAWLATWRLYDVAHMAAAIYVALALFAKQQEPSLLQHSAMDFVNASAIPARQVRRSHARARAAAHGPWSGRGRTLSPPTTRDLRRLRPPALRTRTRLPRPSSSFGSMSW